LLQFNRTAGAEGIIMKWATTRTLPMSNKSLRSLADDAALLKMHKPLGGRPVEPYVTDSPSLGSYLTGSGEGSAPAAKAEPIGSRRGQTRAIWVLSGWLVVSVAMIALAGLVIVRYF
jgi:hypothetical protein